MRTALVIIIALTTQFACAQAKLEVVVSKVKSADGNIRVGIFKDEGSFLTKAAWGKVVKAEPGKVTVVFESLPAGTYGISAIHDENSNNELDKGMFGIPKEGYGFGNDAMGTFGPPSFEKASITIGTEPKIISIAMKYH